MMEALVYPYDLPFYERLSAGLGTCAPAPVNTAQAEELLRQCPACCRSLSPAVAALAERVGGCDLCGPGPEETDCHAPSCGEPVAGDRGYCAEHDAECARQESEALR